MFGNCGEPVGAAVGLAYDTDSAAGMAPAVYTAPSGAAAGVTAVAAAGVTTETCRLPFRDHVPGSPVCGSGCSWMANGAATGAG
ncbi:hypothetical protein AB4Z54_04785, partial [Streptomyces sp. MCAF7]